MSQSKSPAEIAEQILDAILRERTSKIKCDDLADLLDGMTSNKQCWSLLRHLTEGLRSVNDEDYD